MLLRLIFSMLMAVSCSSHSMAQERKGSTLNICSQSAQTLYFVMGYKQGVEVFEDKWKVKGVYDVNPGNCLAVFETNDQIQAYLSVIKVTDGKAQVHNAEYFANGGFAQDADQEICMSYKSFKYFTSKAEMGACKEGFFKSKSFIYLDIEATPTGSATQHRLVLG